MTTCVTEGTVAVNVPRIISVVQNNLRNNGKLQNDRVSGAWHVVRAHWHRAVRSPFYRMFRPADWLLQMFLFNLSVGQAVRVFLDCLTLTFGK